MGCATRHKVRPARMSLGGDIAGGVLSGASTGSAFGPIGMGIGAVVGGITGFIGNKKEEEAKKKALRQRQLTQEAGDYFADLSHLQAFDNQFNAAFGIDMGVSDFGMNRPGFNADIEPTEVTEGLFKIEGPDHRDGGVGVDANLDGYNEFELEGGEVVNDDQVYSKRMKVPQAFIDEATKDGISLTRGNYAQTAEQLGRMKDKYLEKMESIDQAAVNTGLLMIDRIDNLLSNLFYTQEFSKLDK